MAASLAAPSYEGLLSLHVPTYAQYAGQGTAMSTCLDATPPLSLEQCALRKPHAGLEPIGYGRTQSGHILCLVYSDTVCEYPALDRRCAAVGGTAARTH